MELKQRENMLVKQVDFGRICGIKPQTVQDLIKHKTIDLTEDGFINLDNDKVKEYMEKRQIKIAESEINPEEDSKDPLLVQKLKLDVQLKIEALKQEKIKTSKLKQEIISKEFVEHVLFGYLSGMNEQIEQKGDELLESIINSIQAEKGRDSKIKKAKRDWRPELQKIIALTKKKLEKVLAEGESGRK